MEEKKRERRLQIWDKEEKISDGGKKERKLQILNKIILLLLK